MPGRPKHPKRDTVVAYVLAHPNETYDAIGVLYAVTGTQIKSWMQSERKTTGTAAVPLRPNSVCKPKAPSNIAQLPAPVPPKVLPADLGALARESVRVILSMLADPIVLKGTSPEKLAATLKVLVDSVELLESAPAGTLGTAPDTTASATQTVLQALMGAKVGQPTYGNKQATGSN